MTALLVLVVAAVVVCGVKLVRAYDQRAATELEVNWQVARLASWNDRADAWERWANATGGSIPQSFLDEVEQITREKPPQLS